MFNLWVTLRFTTPLFPESLFKSRPTSCRKVPTISTHRTTLRERRFTPPEVRALWPISKTIAERVIQGDPQVAQGLALAISYCLHDVCVYGTVEDLEPLVTLITGHRMEDRRVA